MAWQLVRLYGSAGSFTWDRATVENTGELYLEITIKLVSKRLMPTMGRQA